MLLERIYDEDLAQAGYFIGCQAKGEAVVSTPAATSVCTWTWPARHGMTITAVTETHIHADYLSGTRELAKATGAVTYVSGEGGDDWQYGFEAERLHDGDTLALGNNHRASRSHARSYSGAPLVPGDRRCLRRCSGIHVDGRLRLCRRSRPTGPTRRSCRRCRHPFRGCQTDLPQSEAIICHAAGPYPGLSGSRFGQCLRKSSRCAPVDQRRLRNVASLGGPGMSSATTSRASSMRCSTANRMHTPTSAG